ncbi:DMT family transporter [Halomonas binhaiensis]|uniref:DMT family transporter n=1 Tax=Halomonas binhaiensis TaxID=2562282 RepID=A0A5C1NLJ3_9GAMM|nr:DMT family transporter [Halomonas binhaiensis]QEM83591.1 DMT family transporter [Halomonas binhaiensis]
MSPSLKGIAYMCLGVLCLALGDAVSKWLGASYSTIQIIFFRTLVSLPLIALLAYFSGGLGKLRTRRPKVHLVRGLIYAGAMACFVTGLTMMPLAEATAIAFAAPLFVSLLSVPLLNEKVQPPVILASLIGFVGVLVVVRPSFSGISLGALFALGAALFYALMMITSRRYGTREYLWAMVFYMALVPFVLSSFMLPFVWQTPMAWHWPGFLLSGTLGVGATVFITLAFRHAPAAIAAPFDYTAMLWAVLLGWGIWGEVPDIWVLIGGTLIIGSGLSIAYQEGRTSLKRRPTV